MKSEPGARPWRRRRDRMSAACANGNFSELRQFRFVTAEVP
jgi:hypothetical protein